MYYDRHYLGAGKHIYIYNGQHSADIERAVEALKHETGLELKVRKGLIHP